MTIKLSGITWDHPRGLDPLTASIARYRASHPNIEIEWTARSLKDFGKVSLEELAMRFDLIIFDHPFVGQAARKELLVDLKPYLDASSLAQFEEGAIGCSWLSYHWQDKILGLPIDVAAQVAAFRPDLLCRGGHYPPATFAQIFDLALALREEDMWVGLTACPTDAICMFVTLASNQGFDIPGPQGGFIDARQGTRILEQLKRLVDVSHPDSVDMNPIKLLDRMSQTDEIAYVPYAFGYSNYSRVGAERFIQFTDIVAAGPYGCAGAILGGAGFGVTTRCRHVEEAVNYGRWLCSPEYQQTHYFADGGQPGMMQAWADAACDRAARGFFSGTLRTLTSAYMRPRVPGFVPFFEEAGGQINAFFRNKLNAADLIGWLNAEFSKLSCQVVDETTN
jgi:multiple sugar transport system substrate-binding protein